MAKWSLNKSSLPGVKGLESGMSVVTFFCFSSRARILLFCSVSSPAILIKLTTQNTTLKRVIQRQQIKRKREGLLLSELVIMLIKYTFSSLQQLLMSLYHSNDLYLLVLAQWEA